MLAAEVPESDEKKQIAWYRCPDRLDNSVFRQFDHGSGWLVWGWRPSKQLHGFESSSERTWVRAEIELGEESAEVWVRTSTEPNDYEISIRLQNLYPLDLLIDDWGAPPSEVVIDWTQQLGRDSVADSDLPESDLGLDIPLSHLLSLPDGRLITIRFIEERLQRSSVFHDSAPPPILLSRRWSDESEVQPFIKNVNCFADIARRRNTSATSIKLGTTKTDPFKPTSDVEPASDSKIVAQNAIEIAPVSNGPLASTTPKPHRQIKGSKNRLLVIGCAAGLLIAASTVVLLPSLMQSTVSDDPTISTAVKKREASMNAFDASAANSAPNSAMPSEAIDATPNSQKTGTDDLSPENAMLTLSNVGDSLAQLSEQADTSLQSLMASFGSNTSSDNADATLLNSVQEMFAKRDSQKVIEETFQAPDVGLTAGQTQAAASPFAESLADNDTMSTTDESSHVAESVPAIASDTKSLPEVGSFHAEQPISNSFNKTSIRIPFRPQEKSSICRVQLDVPKNVLYKPENPYVLSGRQDVSWTVALEDDSVSLKVYLRSKPARAWYIATAVRVKLSTEVEFPLGPTDAINVCARLQNYLASLDKQRSMLEAMKSNSKVRSNATDALKVVDKEIKQTDKNLKTWREIQELATIFYHSNAIKLDFASSEDRLPPLATVKETGAKE